MVKGRVSKTCLQAELCFHRFVHLLLYIYIYIYIYTYIYLTTKTQNPRETAIIKCAYIYYIYKVVSHITFSGDFFTSFEKVLPLGFFGNIFLLSKLVLL